jgi:hypothetical protein
MDLKYVSLYARSAEVRRWRYVAEALTILTGRVLAAVARASCKFIYTCFFITGSTTLEQVHVTKIQIILATHFGGCPTCLRGVQFLAADVFG